MAKLIATIKAVITRVLFGTHGFIAIWQVARNKENPIYWYLCAPIGLLVLEGLFTLAIKKNQEWRWFCPSVFIYLSSVVPAIWLLELDKIERRLRFQEETGNLNLTAIDLKKLDKLLGVQIKLPDIQVDPSTWITLIEQFLMLVLIVGRWMLPKGDLTRDQLSQLLLVYIGTAADIIEFFDSYKDNTIASEALLVFLTLGIWSWSLLQFTIVLSATRSRKPRGGGGTSKDIEAESNDCCGGCCCSIDVWGITLNILLQDAPFLAFRLLIIIHYRIISYMNVFFTCKNTLVILLQLYRLYVVHTENRKANKKKMLAERDRSRKRNELNEMNQFNDIYIISSGKFDKKKHKRNAVCDIGDNDNRNRRRKTQGKQVPPTSSSTRKDTGYSTASSQTNHSSNDERHKTGHHHQSKDSGKSRSKEKRHSTKEKRSKEPESDRRSGKKKKSHRKKHSSSEEIKKAKNSKDVEAFTEESSDSSESSSQYEIVHEKKQHKREKNKKKISSSSSSTSE
ncbi:Transmembrane protein [Pseudolycoriella hygida]|uniref:Transmembrane protein n=1 Tax=Pseudolycoriella hygida TaxID=35572 RepID=A0A9Q0MPE5_9DIPT|nr:Transmembrane protein [Pseudolycoriella hygida]